MPIPTTSIPREANRHVALFGVSSVDGITPVAVYVDPTTHLLATSATSTEGATVANGGALPAVVKVTAGYDGSAVRVLSTDSSGRLILGASAQVIGAVTQSGTWNIGTVTTLSQFSAAAALGDGVANPTTTITGAIPLVYNGATYDRLYGDKFAGLWANLKPTSSGGLTTSALTSAASTNGTSVKASAGQIYGWALFNNTASNKFFKIYNKASAPTVGSDTPFMRIMIPPNGGTNVWFGNGIPLGTGIAFAITGAAADSDTTAVAANDVFVNLFYA